MRADIAAGGTFPDYELTDHTKMRRRLSDLQGNDPMILVLARGHYCPKDQQQHRQLAAFQPEVAVAYNRHRHRLHRQYRRDPRVPGLGRSQLDLPVGRRPIQKDLDIQEYTDPYNDPIVPHTFVLKPKLVIYSVYNGYWYWGRPSIEDLRRDLRAVTGEIRPDWASGRPGSGRRGEAGDRSTFLQR